MDYMLWYLLGVLDKWGVEWLEARLAPIDIDCQTYLAVVWHMGSLSALLVYIQACGWQYHAVLGPWVHVVPVEW